jgi:Family of unknown function (DUF5343)
MEYKQDEKRRPYAAAANVVSILNRVRTRNLRGKIDGDFYRLAGIPDQVSGRVTQALTFLGLIDEEGTPTTTLAAMAEAPEAEFKELLAASIREAYAEDFVKIDPAQDSQGQIIDAFRKYEPRSQTARMVMLFLGLAREAGIPVKDAPRDRKMASPSRTAKAKPTVVQRARRDQRALSSGAPATSPSSPTDSGLLFGVTIEDVAALGEEDFDAVWNALGKVARARAMAKNAPPVLDAPAEEDSDDEVEDDG